MTTKTSKGSKGKKSRSWNPHWRRRGKSKRGGTLGYSVEKVSELLGLSRSTVYSGIETGYIPHVKVGGLLIIPKQAFHEKFGGKPEMQEESAAAA
jgi:excisionase family DNA binding protein